MSVVFIKRPQPISGEIWVRIYHDAGQVLGEVHSPDGLTGSHTAAEADKDGALGVHQALASAIELAARRGSNVSVIDEDGLWNPDWGDLVENPR